MNIGKFMKERRLELGLTLKDVASALGVTESTVSRYETCDIKNMGIDKINALANVLQCDSGHLLGRNPDDVFECPVKFKECIERIERLCPEKQKEVFDYISFLESRKSNDD